MSKKPTAPTPSIHPRYELRSPLNAGGMGAIYKAWDRVEEKTVVIKYCADASHQDKFLHEFEILYRLDHPQLPKVYDVDFLRGPYFTMEWIEGSDLSRILRAEKNISPSLFYSVFFQMLSVLQYLHRHNLVHYDVKPENIMLRADDTSAIALIDFGLAADISDRQKKFSETQGTVQYSAPEIIKKERSDGRSDLYSLGVVLFEMACGTNPFDDADVVNVVVNHLEKKITDVTTPYDFIDEPMKRIILKLLEKNQEYRYQNVEEIYRDAQPLRERFAKMWDADEFVLSSCFMYRQNELDRLGEHFSSPTEKLKTVWITGEEGAGKSALVHEFKLNLQKQKHYVVHLNLADTFASGLGNLRRFLAHVYYEFRKPELSVAFKQEIRWITETGSAQASDQTDPASMRARLSDFVVEAVSPSGGLLVLMEDWDAASPFERDFFKNILRKLHLQPKTRIFFGISSANSEDLFIQSELNGFHVPVENFSREQTDVFIAGLLNDAGVKPEITETIYNATRGNLLLIERTLVYLIQTGALKFSGKEWKLVPDQIRAIPASISDFVLSKIDRLSEKEEQLLRRASVFPSFFTTEELKIISPDENTFYLTDKMIRLGLWVRHDTEFIFHNQFLREHEYAELPESEKKQWHGRLAHAYEPKEPARVPELAYHYFRSDERSKALPYLFQLAEIRRAEFLPREALQSLLQASEILRVSDQTDVLIETLFKVEELSDQIGERTEQKKTIEEILKLAEKNGRTQALILGLLRQANYYERISKYEESQKICEKAIALSKTQGDHYQLGQLYRQLGKVYYRRSLWDLALENHREAFQWASATGDQTLIMQTHNSLGTVYGSKELYNEAKREFEESLRLAEKLNDVSSQIHAFFNLGHIANRKEQLDEALSYYRQSEKLIQQLNSKQFLLRYHQYTGLVLFNMKDFEQALEHFLKASDLSTELEDDNARGKACEHLSLVYKRIGFNSQSEHLIKEAVAMAVQVNNKKDLSIYRLYQSEILLEARRVEEAKLHLEDAVTYFTNSENHELRFFAELLLLKVAVDTNFEAVNIDERLGGVKAVGEQAQHILSHSLKILAYHLASKAMRMLGKLTEALEYSSEAVRLLENEKYYEFVDQEVYYNHYAIILGSNKSRFEIGKYLEKAYQAITKVEHSLKRSDFKTSYLNIPLHQDIVNDYKHFFSEARESEIQSFRILYEMTKDINSILDSEKLFDRIMDNAIENTKSDRGLIILKSETGLEIKVARNVDQESLSDLTNISQSIVEEVYATGQSLVTADANLDDRFKMRKSIVAYNIRSIMCVPLRIKNDIIGAVYVDKQFDTYYFSPQNLKFLETFANLAGVAIENARLYEKVHREKEYLAKENLDLKSEIQEKYLKYQIVGRSKAMRQVFHLIETAADNTANVLIQGESGTGKELVAKAIHYNGSRKSNKFVAVDCGALPENLLESELFGYKKGAFTGAAADKKGLFEEANGGTIFLDEITNTSLNFQSRFLRVIQEGEIRRVGDNETRKIDVRVIAATNRDLLEQVKAGLFREDLYYRLNVVPVFLPALRERREDIPLLVQFLIDKHNKLNGKSIQSLSAELMQRLTENAWNGNIRELENVIHRMIIFSTRDRLGMEDLPDEFKSSFEKIKEELKTPAQTESKAEKNLEEFEAELLSVEKEYFNAVLKSADGNKTKAAEILGIKRTTLNDRLKKLGL